MAGLEDFRKKERSFQERYLRRGLDSGIVRSFRTIIRSYYQKYGRDLPWRRTKDTYRIFVSEIMLQQTQVERVLKKYEEFLALFPDFGSLANTRLDRLLKVWTGMGYNRRALAMKTAAEKVVNEYNGVLPMDPDQLITFPGIGKATAGSIPAFAFDLPTVFIETNIRRVYIHFFFRDDSAVHDNAVIPIVEKTLDRSDPKNWYYALMDYGVMLGRRDENQNRRSVHYAKQSRFEGSKRQARGKVLKELTMNPGRSVSEIRSLIKGNGNVASDIISQLEKEGFIRKVKGRYFIK